MTHSGLSNKCASRVLSEHSEASMKSKQIQKWTLGAEVVSALAVVMTIGFLAAQTMENTNAIQAQTFQELMRDLNDWRMSMAYGNAPPELSAALEKRRNEGWDSLDDRQKVMIRGREVIIWSIYESSYFANQRDVLGDDEWTRFETAMCERYSRPNFDWDWPEARMREVLTPKFVAFIAGACE